MITQERRRFGKARTALTALGMIWSAATTLLRVFTADGLVHDLPDTARPPRASYPAEGSGGWVAVDLDQPATGWTLADLHPADTLTTGPYQHVDVWLTHDSTSGASPDVVAHVGPHRVGTLPAPAAATFTDTLRAAALFDEDPWTTGRLVQLNGTTVLEIRIPGPPKT